MGPNNPQNYQYQQPNNPYQPVVHSPEWYKAKRLLTVLLVLWLAAIPLSVVLQVVVRFALAHTNAIPSDPTAPTLPKTSPVQVLNNILSILLGLYGLLGWIPVLITYSSWKKKS